MCGVISFFKNYSNAYYRQINKNTWWKVAFLNKGVWISLRMALKADNICYNVYYL